MGRELQKKKNRSSRNKVRHKPKSKRINIHSNPIVAANWDSSQTLSQNYARLGLTSKLNARAGGLEPLRTLPFTAPDALSIPSQSLPKSLIPSTARVVRDPDTGAITSVVHDSPPPDLRKSRNPLNDSLNGLDSEESGDEAGEKNAGGQGEQRGVGIVRQLEAAAQAVKQKKPRMQSRREEDWIERLVRRWGEDFEGMMRDRRLNPGQQSEGDLRRRVNRWRESGRTVTVGTSSQN